MRISRNKLNRSRFAVSSLAFTCLLSGCFAAPYSDSNSSTLQTKDLFGTYQCKFSSGMKTLVLNKNGTFKHTLVKDTGKTFAVTGKWKLDPDRDTDGGQLLNLEGKIDIDESTEKVLEGSGGFPVGNIDGKGPIYIGMGEDVSYEQVSGQK